MVEIELNPFIFPALVSIILVWCITKLLYKPNGSKNSPPSPPKLPILGNFHQLGPLPHHSLHSLARKHGPVMLLHLGSVPVLVVSSADAAREVLKTHDIETSDRPQYKAFKKLFYDCKNITSSPYGEYWRRLRSIFVLKLLSSKRVQSFRSVWEVEAALLVRRIREFSGPVNLSEMFAEFPNDIICRAAFGTKFRVSEKGKKLLLLIEEFMELLGTISIGDFIPWLGWIDRVSGVDQKFDRVAKEVNDFLDDFIQETKEGGKNGENFVDIMLQILKENRGEVSIGMEGIKSTIMDVFAGGTDTISTALEWTMTEVLRHPRVMQKLQNEVREIVKEREEITEDELDKMHYLKAVIKESLRCHPPAPVLVPHAIRKDVKIKGYDVSRGTIVMINAWAIGRDQECWEEPEMFWPERFLNSPVDFKGLHFELIPFGAGRRSCPGMTYGIAVIELLLATLLSKFYWNLPDGADGKYLDMSEKPGITVGRVVPLLALATQS